MTNSKSDDSLVEWNRLNKENAEQGFVSAIFQSMTETTTIIDKFSLWLLGGTGVTGALLITQINSVIPGLTLRGFKVCLMLLVISAVFGFLAKYKALRCEMQVQMQVKLEELIKPVLAKHEEDEDKILDYASNKGINLQTDIELSNIIAEFSRPFPWWAKRLIARKVKKTEGDRQAGFHVAVLAYTAQLRWTFLQSCFFLAFMVAGAWYANAI